MWGREGGRLGTRRDPCPKKKKTINISRVNQSQRSCMWPLLVYNTVATGIKVELICLAENSGRFDAAGRHSKPGRRQAADSGTRAELGCPRLVTRQIEFAPLDSRRRTMSGLVTE